MSSIYVVVIRDAEKRELLVIPFGKDKSIYHIRPDGSRGKISLHSSGYHHQKTFNYKAKEYRYIEESKGKQKSPLKTDHFRPLTIYHWNIGASFDNFKPFRKNSNKNNIVSVNEKDLINKEGNFDVVVATVLSPHSHWLDDWVRQFCQKEKITAQKVEKITYTDDLLFLVIVGHK